MKRTCTTLSICAVTALLTFLLTWGGMNGIWKSNNRQQCQNQVLTVQKIQPLSILATLRVEVADAEVTRISGITGSAEATILVKGIVILGVTLAEAKFQDVDEKSRTAVLILPQPTVQSAALDHSRTKLLAFWDSGLWRIVPGGEEADAVVINRDYENAQSALTSVANDAQLIEQSKRQAIGVLGAFFGTLEWNVEIRWR